MAKKDKPSVDKIVKRVSKEFDKTSDRVEGIVSEAMKRFNDEVDRRLKELHELQDSLMERFGVASTKKRNDGDTKTKAKSGTTTATAKKSSGGNGKAAASKSKTASRKPSAKSAASKPATAKATTSAKSAAKKSTAPAKSAKTAPLDKSDLKKVKGIGPATEKKMKEAGITTIDQIANPSAEDQEKLKSFAKVRGSDSWTAEAKKLL